MGGGDLSPSRSPGLKSKGFRDLGVQVLGDSLKILVYIFGLIFGFRAYCRGLDRYVELYLRSPLP